MEEMEQLGGLTLSHETCRKLQNMSHLTVPSLPSIQAILTHSAVTYGSVRIGLYETLKEHEYFVMITLVLY
jgi:hypothetical protein